MSIESNKMIKVLQIVAAPCRRFPRSGVNGPERRASNLVSRWGDYGVSPLVAYPSRGKLWHNFENSGASLVDFEIGSKYDFAAIFRLRKIVREHHIDIIHTQGPGSLDAIATMAAKFAGVPIVVTRPFMIQDDVQFTKIRRWFYECIDRVTLSCSSAMIAVMGQGAKDLVDVYGVPQSKVRLIYNGVKLSRFEPRESSSAGGLVDDEPVVLGMVAQLTSVKGWPDFLKVISELNHLGKNVRGMVVGDGPLREELEALADKLGISDIVEFTGHRENVSECLAQIDILLFPSYREGLSVAIIEALAMGLPIVASDVGGIHEQVEDGENGHICGTGDIEAYVAKCIELIESPDMRRVFGARSRVIAESKFSEDRMLKEHVLCYGEFVK